jgi:hypothetical protein
MQPDDERFRSQTVAASRKSMRSRCAHVIWGDRDESLLAKPFSIAMNLQSQDETRVLADALNVHLPS